MNVLMISTHGLTIDPRIYNESITLLSAGHNIEVISWDRENSTNGVDETEIDGIRIKRFYVKSKYGTGLKQVVAYVKFIWKVRDYIRHKDIDVVHGHDIDGAFIGTFLKGRGKLVWDMRELYDGSGHGRIKKAIYNAFAQWCFRHIDGLIVVVDYQLERYRKKIKPGTLCEVILNTAERRLFDGFERKEATNRLRISYIGSVRQFDELRLLMDCCKHFDDVSIGIHGSGTALERLLQVSSSYRNVNITGSFYYKDIKIYYENTDLLYVVYDKNVENQKYGIPIKGYEAITTLTPVIVGKDTYFAEFVEKHDIGFVISGDDLHELENIILSIRKDRDILKTKEDNMRRIKHLFLWERQSEKLVLFYQLLSNQVSS